MLAVLIEVLFLFEMFSVFAVLLFAFAVLLLLLLHRTVARSIRLH